jgi:hypothetical protein
MYKRKKIYSPYENSQHVALLYNPTTWTINRGWWNTSHCKREKGKTWSSPIQDQGLLGPYATDQEQKQLNFCSLKIISWLWPCLKKTVHRWSLFKDSKP